MKKGKAAVRKRGKVVDLREGQDIAQVMEGTTMPASMSAFGRLGRLRVALAENRDLARKKERQQKEIDAAVDAICGARIEIGELEAAFHVRGADVPDLGLWVKITREGMPSTMVELDEAGARTLLAFLQYHLMGQV
jgi:hypothetical protein